MKKTKKNRWDDVEVPDKRRPIDLPAGHQRDELSRKVSDQLAEEAEELQAETGVMAIDPAKLAPDREIIQVLDSQGVTESQPGYVYNWVRFRSASGIQGLAVDEKLSWKVKINSEIVPVWEVVKGAQFPEAKERLDVNGYRTIGDTILLRARQERYDALMEYFEWQHERRISSEAMSIQQYAEKKIIKIHTFDATKGLDERGKLAAKSATSNMKRNHRMDLSAAEAIINEARRDGKSTTLLEHGLKQMLGMQIAQQYVEKRIREGTLHLTGD